MPISRKRKKQGKKVKRGTLTIDPNKESHVTLQDLINVLAYQEYVKDGTIIADDANITVPDKMPVTIINEDGEKVEVGEASPIPGDPEHVSIHITDEDVLKQVQGPIGNFSIEENKDER